MELITPSLGTIFWMSIAFFIVLFILKKYAWRPILGFLKERENSIQDALLSAQKAKEEMSKLVADNEKIIAEAKNERDKIIIEARELKESIINDARNNALEEARKMIDTAKQSIKKEKETAINEIKEQIITLSVDIAGKILQQKLTESPEQKEFIEKSLRDIKLN
ncbi:MAG: F0F1 ATP synthase subunit B [Bacteroidales bacterium]|nr:F0F1 ATP synthase subunit B [Bacteroidales bacterium]